MPTGNVTITATTGPGRAVTAQQLLNVQSFTYNMVKNMIYFNMLSDDPTTPAREFALTNTTTFVATLSGGVWTITIVAS